MLLNCHLYNWNDLIDSNREFIKNKYNFICCFAFLIWYAEFVWKKKEEMKRNKKRIQIQIKLNI